MPTQRSILSKQREQEVARLLLTGCSNREMATKMGVTARTIKFYMGRLFRRYDIAGGNKRIRLATLLAKE